MRVAHIITRLILGGAQENTLFNVDDQHHLFHDEVCLITGPGLGPEGSLETQARQRQLDVRIVPQLQRALSPLRDLQAYREIVRQLKDFAPELVHTHSSKAGILGRLAAHQLGIPAVHTIHGASFHFGQSPLLHRAYRVSEKLASRWCRHYISVCDAMTHQYVAAGIAPEDRFTTIYSGMDVDQFLRPARSREQVREALGIQPDRIVVGKVARLFNLKGHEYLISAAPEVVRAVPEVVFLLVGDGILRQEFEQRIADLNLTQHFVFAGLVPPDAVSEYLHAMDVVVHTSVWEGLARVLPQALIAGKPIVSFDNDGAPEVCLHESTGLLVPARDVPALSAAIIRLAGNPELSQRLGDQGRQRFTEQFRHETMTERIRHVYQRVLDGTRNRQTDTPAAPDA